MTGSAAALCRTGSCARATARSGSQSSMDCRLTVSYAALTSTDTTVILKVEDRPQCGLLTSPLSGIRIASNKEFVASVIPPIRLRTPVATKTTRSVALQLAKPQRRFFSQIQHTAGPVRHASQEGGRAPLQGSGVGGGRASPPRRTGLAGGGDPSEAPRAAQARHNRRCSRPQGGARMPHLHRSGHTRRAPSPLFRVLLLRRLRLPLPSHRARAPAEVAWTPSATTGLRVRLPVRSHLEPSLARGQWRGCAMKPGRGSPATFAWLT